MSSEWPIVVVLAALAILLASGELFMRRRIRQAADEGTKRLPDLAALALPWHSDPVKQLAAVYDRLQAEIQRERSVLREELRRRARAEEQLRESRERYALAVEGANDGMWEWNLKSGTARFSARWKSMLGYREPDVGESIVEWHDRIHPEDRERTLAALQAHVSGMQPRFESEHRIRQRDGGWRWVLSRAVAMRRASGAPYRVVGLNTDISARKHVERTLFELAGGLSELRGEAAYCALVEKFAAVVGTREAFLAECVDFPSTRVRMLAYWCHGALVPNQEFDLATTPCEEVVCNRRPLFVPNALAERFPAVRPLGVESYVGLPCIDTRGIVIGHIVCKDTVALAREIPHDAILKLFAMRASVELERRLLWRIRQRDGEMGGAATLY